MKTYIFTFEDDYLGIPLIIAAELTDYEDNSTPFAVIQSISFDDKPLEMWCLSDSFIKHLEDSVLRMWFKGSST